jgi:outer membrane receptor for ferrienterochelin and colicins
MKKLSKVKLIVLMVGISLLVLPTSIVAGEFCGISGTVVDRETGEPLPSVNIVVKGTHLGSVTDEDGQYLISCLSPGSYKIIAIMIGYTTVVKDVVLAEGETANLAFFLTVNPIEGSGIVVTGTRTPRYIKDVPVRTEVITSRQLEKKEAQNLYEALNGAPGVRVEQQCSACNFSILRIQGLESGHVQVLIDGEPTYSGLASVYGLQQVTSGNIDRIEIVKGAGSALYGSSAIGGVVNIISKEPSAAPSLDSKISIGTDNTNQFGFSASRKLGKTGMMLSAQKNTTGEIDEDADGSTDRVKTDNLSLGLKLHFYNILGNDRISLGGVTINEQRQGGDLSMWENPFVEGSENIKTTRYEANVGYRNNITPDGELNVNFAYSQHNRNATNDAFLGDYMSTHSDAMPPVDEMQPYIADEDLYVAGANYGHVLGFNRILLGGQYTYNELDESGRYVVVDEEDQDYGGTYTSTSEKYAHDYGVYVQDEISLLGDIVEIVLGVRYDKHKSKDEFGGSGDVAPQDVIAIEYDETAVNPRGAVRVKVTPQLTIRGSAGTGFRVPYGFSEDLHLCSGSPRVNKPAGLKPEKSTSFNLGTNYSTDRFAVSLNVFRTDLKYKIGFADAGDASAQLGYTYEWENIGDAYTQGLETVVKAALLPIFALNLDFTYTNAQYENPREDWVEHPAHGNTYAENSKYISRVPQTTGGIELNFTPERWDMVIGAEYTGRMYIDYINEDELNNLESYIKHTDPFWVFDARLAYDFELQQNTILSLFTGVKNAFDYVQEERHSDDAAFMYAPFTGRTIYGGLRVKI